HAFLVYAAFGALSALAYRKLSPAVEPPPAGQAARLARSRRVVLELAALFSLDSFGGGLAIQSIVALWLFRRFAVPVSEVGAIFFAVTLLAGGLLQRSLFGWPLVLAGLLKAGYDLALFAKFAQRKPSEAGD